MQSKAIGLLLLLGLVVPLGACDMGGEEGEETEQPSGAGGQAGEEDEEKED